MKPWSRIEVVPVKSGVRSGIRSLTTGPVATLPIEKPGGGGGMFAKAANENPRKIASDASPIAPSVDRKVVRPTVKPRPIRPPAMIPPRNPTVAHNCNSGV